MNSLIEIIAENFKKGQIGIFPTDTAFGIGCRIDNEQAVKKIYELRNRPAEKALLALVSSIEMAQQYVHISDNIKKDLIDSYWPGGLTIVLPCIPGKVLPSVTAGKSTLAVRMPDHEELISVIQNVGVPIVAPSANRSGERTPLNLEDVDKELLGSVDFVMNGVCTIKGQSTIVDCTQDRWKIIRSGVVKLDETT